MASHLQLLLFLFLVTINNLSAAQKTFFHGGFLLGITKDPQIPQYTTQLLIGTPQLPTKLVVHLSGQSLWLNCAQSSSSRQLVRHGSLPCSMAKSGAQSQTASTICNVHQENPFTGSTNFGDLAEDIVTVDDGFGSPATVDRFLFSCSPEHLQNGLATDSNGVLGFGRSKIAFQSQAVNNFDIPRKFTLCLSSTDGFIVSGTGISKSLSYTPLISTHGLDGYFVNVKSVKINGRRLALHDGGKHLVEISTVAPYTTMKTPIYKIFTKAYVNAASSMNMTTVAPVAPFGVCFSSQQSVPEIELALQSELVKWKIQGRNSMVHVSDSVMCLGFVDGGLNMSGSMALGGYQLEDHILEFNLGTGMMGFSPSLLMEGKSCSNMKRGLVSKPIESS